LRRWKWSALAVLAPLLVVFSVSGGQVNQVGAGGMVGSGLFVVTGLICPGVFVATLVNFAVASLPTLPTRRRK
jgi:hypothetical protein